MKANIILAVITILFASFFLVQAFQMPSRANPGTVGPAGWAIMVLTFMLVMGIILLVKEVWVMKKGTADAAETDKTEEQTETVSPGKSAGTLSLKYRHFYILAAIAVYIMLLPILGFVVVTPLLFFFIAWLLGMGKIVKVAIISLASNVAIILVFIHVLNIPFPRGTGVFRSISFLIY
ncbi:hypothetical protein CR205_16355 [Alteribacter lacisalsi]|uniref:DUF1468 domain-containing protein n=1 Tax=Alteribacter lacisalsi TaxID=2045244 RepID=A0A2W0H460_9BACI|nr:tripartite tricarboxylate transporter TctB family protein [Alteribacter lacisalsi]PYZ95947.1 hypothetical protein CR205_16355 [Alteribacter lacisalsi]